jgi:hypothetical protein
MPNLEPAVTEAKPSVTPAAAERTPGNGKNPRHPPVQWPAYEQWQKEIAAVRHLPTNPGSEPQQVLDAVLSVSAAEWDRFWSVFLELVTFSPWL